MLATIFIMLAALPALLFPIIYALTARWYISPLGRSLMMSGATKLLIISLVVLSVLMDAEYPGREYVRPVIWGLIATMLWTQLISYIVTVRRVRRQRQEENHVQ